jgi:uncharacterized membrane protein (DUF2068 family)
MADITTNTGIPVGPKRPTLLTVLCILTFIGSSWGFLEAIRTYRNADVLSAIVSQTMKESKEKVKEEVKDDAAASQLAEKIMNQATSLTDPDKMKKSALYKMVYSLICLFGAYLMFNLRKIGFWVYLVGAAIYILTPMAVYGAGNILIGVGTVLLALVMILFCVLYSLNLKYMS